MSDVLETFTRAMHAVCDGDEAALRNLYTDDVAFDDPIVGTLKGVDAVASYLAKVAAPFTEVSVEIAHVVTEGDRAAVEWVQSNTSSDGLLVVRGAAFVTVVDGRISRQQDYFQFPPRTKGA